MEDKRPARWKKWLPWLCGLLLCILVEGGVVIAQTITTSQTARWCADPPSPDECEIVIRLYEEGEPLYRELTADREQRTAILDAMKELRYVDWYGRAYYSGDPQEDYSYTLCVTEPPGTSSTKYLDVNDAVAHRDFSHWQAGFENTDHLFQVLDACFAGEI